MDIIISLCTHNNIYRFSNLAQTYWAQPFFVRLWTSTLILLQHVPHTTINKLNLNIYASLIPHTHTDRDTMKHMHEDSKNHFSNRNNNLNANIICIYLHWLASTHKTHIIPLLRSNDVDYPQLIIYNTWQSCFRCTPTENMYTIRITDIHHCSLKTACLYLLPHLLFN